MHQGIIEFFLPSLTSFCRIWWHDREYCHLYALLCGQHALESPKRFINVEFLIKTYTFLFSHAEFLQWKAGLQLILLTYRLGSDDMASHGLANWPDQRFPLCLNWQSLVCEESPNLNMNPRTETGLQSANCTINCLPLHPNQHTRDITSPSTPYADWVLR